MKKITKELIQQATEIGEKKIQDLFELFFAVTMCDAWGNLELETWTNGGVDMIFYLQETNKIDEFLDRVKHFSTDEEIELHRQDKRYCNDFSLSQSVEDFTEFKKWLEDIAAIISHIYFGSPILDIEKLPHKYSAIIILGTEAVGFYRDKKAIPPEDFINDHGGEVKVVEFDTEIELKAYGKAILDIDGWHAADIYTA